MFVSEGRTLFLEDLKKVRTMISLAVYDKHYGEKDRRITSKYRRDYVYLRGLGMRIGVAMGFFVVCALYYLHRLIINETDIFSMISKRTLIEIGIVLVIVLAIYTVICSFKFKREYDEAETRLNIYEERLKKLNVNSGLKGKKISVRGKNDGHNTDSSAKADRDI